MKYTKLFTCLHIFVLFVFRFVRGTGCSGISQIVETGKMPLLTVLKNFSKKFLDPDPDAHESQNLISFSLSTNAALVKFSRRSNQQFLREVADRQTNRQTDRQTDTYRDRQTDTYRDRQTDTYRDRQTDGQTDTYRDRQTDGQTNAG